MLTATLLTLAAGALHATWNLLVKASADRLLATWGQFLIGGLLFIPLLAITGLPPGAAMPFLAVSTMVHVGYAVALARAYDHGDFSIAYPLARGGGALATALAATALLGDTLSRPAWVALVVVVSGLASLATHRVTPAALAWAGVTAATIATYTNLDTAGARRSSGIAYGITLTSAAGIALTAALVLSGRAPTMVAAARLDWRRHLAGGAAATLAYAMVLTAATLAPLGYVAGLRESSILFGTAASWLFLHEPVGPRHTVSAAAITTGLALLISLR